VYHTQAVNLAADMADRIRANRTNNPNVWRLDAGGTPALINCQTANCNPQQLVQDDQARWLQAIDRQLPGDTALGTPEGTIAVDPAAVPTRYTITVRWSEPGDNQLSYVLTMQI
jgi:hypothetical protein